LPRSVACPAPGRLVAGSGRWGSTPDRWSWRRTSIERHLLLYDRIRDEAIFLLQKLPRLHDDPFDRLLIAHLLTDAATILTPDPWIQKYPVPAVW